MSSTYKVFNYQTGEWYDDEIDRIVFDRHGNLQSICIDGEIIPNENGTTLSCALAVVQKRDKTGRRLYDGDFLEDKKGNIGRVYLNQADARFEIEWLDENRHFRYDTCFNAGEIIGNIRCTASKAYKRFFDREEIEVPFDREETEIPY